MFDLLQEYIALHHQLVLPYIGKISLEKSAAKADFSEKLYYPPKTEWKLLPGVEGTENEEKFIKFLRRKKNINESVAREQLTQFCQGLIVELKQAREVQLPGIGILKIDEQGVLQLETIVANNQLLKPVMADRVIRKDATHQLLVGDSQKTNVEMSELLQSMDESNALHWWAWAAALLVFSIGLLFYGYTNNNWSSRSIGNQKIIQPQPLPVSISSYFK